MTKSFKILDSLMTFFLTLFFVYLKVSGFIDWNWIWVFGPYWIPLAFLISIKILLDLYVFIFKRNSMFF